MLGNPIDYQRKDYNVAIYCRLSNDDGENKESNSIANQKAILLEYITNNGWTLYDIYVDDGYTGTNFQRPAFKRMISDIEKGLISLILTKDMSRLGRDYIQVGYYIERYFPEKGVRYIAVNDNVDTHRDENGDDITPFKAIINDMYSKDISRKIRSVFEVKRREGKFIGAFPPYGYKKDPSNKSHLIIDRETAPVVRRIFEMYLSGEGFTSIAKKLNKEGIMPPSIDKERRYINYKNGRIKVPKWCHSSVKHILTNDTYAGNLSQRKSKKINYKSQKVKRLNKSEWIIKEDTHKPIISQEKFNLVQTLINQKSSNFGVARKKTNLFSGFIFCSDCKQHMTYYKMPKGYYYLICSTYKKYGKEECTRHSYLENHLHEIVLKDIMTLLKTKIDFKGVEERAREVIADQSNERDITEELNIIKKRLEQIKNPIKSLYEDKVKGIITQKQFQELYNEFITEEKNLLARKKKLEREQERNKGENLEEKIKILIDKLYNIKKLNRLILAELINKIEISEDGEVKIYYRIKDEKGDRRKAENDNNSSQLLAPSSQQQL